MPLQNRVSRLYDGGVKVVIDGVEHIMTEWAFVEFMKLALNTMQSIVASQSKENK